MMMEKTGRHRKGGHVRRKGLSRGKSSYSGGGPAIPAFGAAPGAQARTLDARVL